jgi:hypothetical protein
LPRDPLADCHNDLALVNIRAANSINLIRRPTHQLCEFMIGQRLALRRCLKDQLGNVGSSKIVKMLAANFAALRINMVDLSSVPDFVESPAEPVASPRAAKAIDEHGLNALLAIARFELGQQSIKGGQPRKNDHPTFATAGQAIVTTDIIDDMGEKREVELLDLGGASSLAQFRKKARAYIDAHADHVAFARLRQGKPLTAVDLDELQRLFTEADIASVADFGQIRALPDLPNFIRSLVGLDRSAAKAAFNEALVGKTLSAVQIRFIELIVDHLTASGRMEPELLYAPPFTDFAPNGVSDVFGATEVQRIVEVIAEFEPRIASAR